MKVKNISKNSASKCKCGSWLKHWNNYSQQNATICRAKGCSKKATLGAHVIKTVDYDNKWYVVPFCQEHKHRGDAIELVKGTKLVAGNQSATCQKKV